MAILIGRGRRAGRSDGPLGRLIRVAVGLAAAGLWAPGAAAQSAGALEAAVKANYLYKLGPFVGWPAGAFGTPASPFNVCVLGEDPFGRVLDEAVTGQAVGGHPIGVHRPATAVAAAAACHVVYVGRLRGAGVADALRALRGAPVLTVTDARTGGAGGMVHFVLRDGRVRFALDPRAARANGLTFSSKLQALAIPPDPGDGG
jgi:hypothetical protein